MVQEADRSVKKRSNAGDALRNMKESPQYVRLMISFLMQAVAVGYVVRTMYLGGLGDVLSSFYRAKAPWVKQCGLLHDYKEYMIISDRIVARNRLMAGGIHVRGGMVAGTYLSSRASESDIDRVIAPVAGGNGSYAIPVIDYRGYVVGPGVVDVHVHMNEPGRSEWETMRQATKAAAAGGATTVVDMPLNSNPCTTNVQRLREKMRLARLPDKVSVNVGFWAGLVPENAYSASELKKMVKAGAFGFKAFICPSGIDDFPSVSIKDIEAALPVIQSLDVPLLVHAEVVDDADLQQCKEKRDSRDFESWSVLRPPEMERRAVKQIIQALESLPESRGKKSNFRVHVVHIADVVALEEIEKAKKKGLAMTVETCPHYLMFSSETIQAGETEYKCAPPLRDVQNRDNLRRKVLEGAIDSVSSDHSPSPASLKMKDTGDFVNAWGGISGIQYTLPALWTSMMEYNSSAFSPATLHKVLSTNTARLIGLSQKKGKIESGYDADFVIWEPETTVDTSLDACYQTQKLSPYIGKNMKGRVRATFVDGGKVFDSEDGFSLAVCGKVLTRVPPRDLK